MLQRNIKPRVTSGAQQGPVSGNPSPLPDTEPRHPGNTHKENKMNLDHLRRLFSRSLDERVTEERRTLVGHVSDAFEYDCESYFKEVFAGQVL